MSELQNKVESAFKDSANQLKELNSRLESISDLEHEVSSLSGNLQLASNNLRKLAKEHLDYVEQAEELNSILHKVAKSLLKIDPDNIDMRLKKIEDANQTILEQIKMSEEAIKANGKKLIYRIMVGALLVGAAAIYLLFM